MGRGILIFSLLCLSGVFTHSAPAQARAKNRNRAAAQPAPVATVAVSDEQRILDAVSVLERTSEGKFLLESARAFWRASSTRELASRALRPGSVSRTDAVLTRNYDDRTGQETRNREVTIYLHAGQALEALVLDLAHELVHATTRPSWDPYDPDLTAIQYIRAAIDGPGGEVEAVAAECRVALELVGSYGAANSSAVNRCQGYRHAETATVDRDRIADDFYRVGSWFGDLSKRLGGDIKKLPRVSRQDPRLISSTGEAPYPVALFTEYQELTRSACRNSKIRALAEAGRRPASASASEALLARRCSQVFN